MFLFYFCILKKFSDGILIHFGHVQNYLQIEGDLKMIFDKNSKEIIIKHKGTTMVKDGEDWYGLQTSRNKKLGKIL